MMHFLLALHLISVICWFAGLFYLPRLFVYHAMTEETPVFDQFKVMEYKLYYYIMHPALLGTLFTGAGLVFLYCREHALSHNWHFWLTNWLVWKGVLVFGLILFHVRCGRYLKQFRQTKTPKDWQTQGGKTHRFFRMFNEFPTLILIAVVFLAVYQP